MHDFRMAIPRAQLVDPVNAIHYHLVSRCVRKSWLCGYDKSSRRNYEHRKDWLIERLHHLARYFAVAIDAYAIMSNHFHLVVYYDPKESSRWSDIEVTDRWFKAFPPKTKKIRDADIQKLINSQQDELLNDPARLQHARETLGSLSMFMKYLKQPIAYRANCEDKCSGHFFEGRFYSGALLSEKAILAAMIYVDLNPVRAGIVKHVQDYQKHLVLFVVRCLKTHRSGSKKRSNRWFRD